MTNTTEVPAIDCPVERMVRAHDPERAAFEAWWCKAYDPANLARQEHGCYLELSAGMAWDAWQAARPKRADVVRRLPDRRHYWKPHMDYLPHQQRVVDETEELSLRLGKLNAFIGSANFSGVGTQAERDLLLRQAGQMTAYWMTLHERMQLWVSAESENAKLREALFLAADTLAAFMNLPIEHDLAWIEQEKEDLAIMDKVRATLGLKLWLESLNISVPKSKVCRSDGRCQYAIDVDAEELGHCPAGKCVMPDG